MTHFEIQHAILKPGKSDLRGSISEYVGKLRHGQ